MTLAEAGMYYEYAAQYPPIRAMVAAYLGVKPKRQKPSDMGDLLAMFGGPGTIR